MAPQPVDFSARVPNSKADIPNVLTLLPRPRAAMPPVDFQLLANPGGVQQVPWPSNRAQSPRSQRKGPPPSPRDGQRSPRAVSPRDGRWSKAGSAAAHDHCSNMQPLSKRAAMSPRRRPAAVGLGAYAVLHAPPPYVYAVSTTTRGETARLSAVGRGDASLVPQPRPASIASVLGLNSRPSSSRPRQQLLASAGSPATACINAAPVIAAAGAVPPGC